MDKGFPKGGGGGGSDVWEKFPNNIVFFSESVPKNTFSSMNIHLTLENRTSKAREGWQMVTLHVLDQLALLLAGELALGAVEDGARAHHPLLHLL